MTPYCEIGKKRRNGANRDMRTSQNSMPVGDEWEETIF